MSQSSTIRIIEQDELIRLLLTGLTLKEAARHLGKTYQTIRKWAVRPECVEKLKGLSKEIYERVDRELANSKEELVMRLEQASEEALDRLIELAKSSKNEHIVLKSCQDLLDRDGRVSRQRKIESTVNSNVSFIDPLTLQHIAATAKEMDQFESAKRPELPPASVEPDEGRVN